MLVGAGIGNASLVQVQRIHFDDQRRGVTSARLRVLRDVGGRSGCGEKNYRLRISDDRGNPLRMNPDLRYRKRDGNETRVQRAKERDDVGQPLRGQYRSAITRHPALLERACDCLRSPVYLRPRQTLGVSNTVMDTVDECVGRRVRLLLNACAQLRRK